MQNWFRRWCIYRPDERKKSAYETVEIKGIYDIKNASDNALNPTVKKAENLIFSDSQLLINLQEQGVYEARFLFSLPTHCILTRWYQK